MRIEYFPSMPDAFIIMPSIFADDRGRFIETYRISELFGAESDVRFVQGNVSTSLSWVLRGLHYQIKDPQGKLVRCIQGRIYDVAVDMREGSPTLGKWVGHMLDDIEGCAMWVPPGFAHGFLSLASPVIVQYECSSYYVDEFARSMKWDDPDLGITWPLGQGRNPLVSSKDRAAPGFAQAEKVRL